MNKRVAWKVLLGWLSGRYTCEQRRRALHRLRRHVVRPDVDEMRRRMSWCTFETAVVDDPATGEPTRVNLIAYYE